MERIRSEREKALAGEVFRQGDPEMAKRRKRAKHLCFLFNHTDPDDEEGQKKLLEELIGSTSGEYCITAPFYCDYTDKKNYTEEFAKRLTAASEDQVPALLYCRFGKTGCLRKPQPSSQK